MKAIRRHRQRSGQRAMTFAEVMIAMSILGVIFLAAALMQLAAAKQTRALYGQSRTLNRVHTALDHIRYNMAEGLVGSLQVSNSGQAVAFHNPMLSASPGQPISAYAFRNGTLYYFKDVKSTTTSDTIPLLNDVRFEIVGPGRAVRVTVAARQDFTWQRARPYTVVEEITLRN